jgi:hypothetical protein
MVFVTLTFDLHKIGIAWTGRQVKNYVTFRIHGMLLLCTFQWMMEAWDQLGNLDIWFLAYEDNNKDKYWKQKQDL